MKILSTPHAHTTYCDGKQSAEEMVLTAIEKGFVSLGLSEHGEQSIDSGSSLRPHQVAPYIAEVRALQQKYADRIRLHLGIERDFYSLARREDYEYVLGSFHYMKKDGVLCAADGRPEPIHTFRDEHYDGDGAAMAVDFFIGSGKYALDYKPDIFGHFDLLKKHNGERKIYNPDDKRVIDAAFDALDMILKSGAILELNTGGMARSGQMTPYPDMIYLKRWHEIGGRVIVGSDCHNAPQLDYAFDQMPAYLREAGFKTAWMLGGPGQEQFVEFELD